jgi:protein CWC15
MTTAARPTYYAAIGNQFAYGGFKSRMVCAKDQMAHTKLKYRQLGQNTEEEVRSKTLREDLDQKEEEYERQKNKTLNMILDEEKKVDVQLLLKYQPEIVPENLKKYDDADADNGEDDGFDSFRWVGASMLPCCTVSK